MWCAAWEARYGESYPWTAADEPALAKVLAACGRNVVQARALLERYLADDSGERWGKGGSPWKGHPLRYLAEHPTAFAPKAKGKAQTSGRMPEPRGPGPAEIARREMERLAALPAEHLRELCRRARALLGERLNGREPQGDHTTSRAIRLAVLELLDAEEKNR